MLNPEALWVATLPTILMSNQVFSCARAQLPPPESGSSFGRLKLSRIGGTWPVAGAALARSTVAASASAAATIGVARRRFISTSSPEGLALPGTLVIGSDWQPYPLHNWPIASIV